MKLGQSLPLLHQFKILRRLYFGYLVAAILTLVLFFVDKRGSFLLLGVSLIYHLTVIRPHAKSYQKEYVHTCAQLTLERYLESAAHTSLPVLTPEELRAVRLVAANGAKGSILCCEGGQGTSNGRAVKLGDVTFTHSFPMEGKTHHEFVTGIWIKMELDHDTGLDWRLISRRTMMAASRIQFLQRNSDLEILQDPGSGWLEDYIIIPRKGTPALPGADVLASAQKLGEYTPGALAICIQGNHLHVFITNRILGQQVSIREAPAEERIRFDQLPELGYILKLADQL